MASIESVTLHVPDPSAAEAFYAAFSGSVPWPRMPASPRMAPDRTGS